jgi:catechol 2,3-dioxygenase-like lactoylglutathione lyase family enzyme
MRVTRILHASVNVTGALAETADWYRSSLGLDAVPRPEIEGIPGEWFAIGGVQLHLVGARNPDLAIDPTAHHVCFAVENLDAAVAELDAAGIEYRRGGQHHDGATVVQVFIVDPAGNLVELQQDPT